MTSPSRSSVVAARTAATAGWLGPWLALGALALWTASPDPTLLAVAAVGATATALWGAMGRGPVWGVGVGLLVVGILVGFAAHRQVDDVVAGWDRYWSGRLAEVGELLSEELDRRQASGEEVSAALAERWTQSRTPIGVEFLRESRMRHRASAIALYGPGGELLLWDGVHRGRVPEEVQFGEQAYSYRDLPTFGYLYITQLTPGGYVAVVAFLLRADLPGGLDAGGSDLASRFYGGTGERILVTQDDPGRVDGVWDLQLGEDRLLSVVVLEPEPRERASLMMRGWRVGVSVLLLLCWLLLAVGGPTRPGRAALAAVGLLLLAAWLPLSEVPALAMAFRPALFELPGPMPLTLGRFALLGVVAFGLIGVVPRLRFTMPPWAAGLVAGVAFPLLLVWIASGVRAGTLAAGRLEWIAYQLGAAAALALAAGSAIALTRASGRFAGVAVVLAVLVAAVLGAGAAAWTWVAAHQPGWWPALWAVPVALAAVGAAGWGGWQRRVATWSLAVVLGATAAIPVAWGHRVAARMAEGEERLAALAAAHAPELERGLFRLGAVADSLDRRGRADVDILYSAWRVSGLAELGQPLRLTMWRGDGSPGEELRAGVEVERPEVLDTVLERGRALGGVELFQLDRDDARYVITTALRDGRMMTAVAPPFAQSTGRSALGPLLRGASGEVLDALTIIPLFGSDPGPAEQPTWSRIRTGWQADAHMGFRNQTAYHVHYAVNLPGPLLGTARGTLLLVLNFALFGIFWLTGHALAREAPGSVTSLSGLAISFRARVTLALFGFFTLANVLFGTVAYRTLERTSQRSAQVIAERVVEDAARWYLALGGGMERLAQQVGAELMEYRGDELVGGSVEELVELGLYEGWTPYEVHQLLDGREGVREFTTTSLGRWEYVTAYRRLPVGDVLAAQVPLQAGTTAIQTTDLVEILGFVVLLGAGLSLVLALTAGRALTRPIHALQVASERVGSGNLGLRLPEDRADEFGAVFRAFNRMVARVRRARRQLVRTSRRTQLIMDEAAVGMVAMDPAGKVTLVNPRAEELLGFAVPVGRPLPEEGPLGEALSTWLTSYLESEAEAADSELHAGERRVRVRARRLGSAGTRRGAVVAMDDVTDELRAERVLAWGEMARQVAHEVKNPLTPIKLSIQHVRRAWDDRHPRFEEILVKNVDAMLKEIDRLAGIAQSFSRFGAPGGDLPLPLMQVSLATVVDEVMALYGGSAAPLRFEQDIEPDLPPVVARSAELKEVLVNLLENARLAGHDGGVVSILAHSGATGRVVLDVVDDGCGIPADALPRVFEPQFSTRSTGTGLGLAIVQRLVRGWGGRVVIRSVQGEGTTVSVVLRTWPEGGSDGSGPVPSEGSS